MTKMTITLTGGKELSDKLARLSEAVASRNLAAAAMAGAQAILNAAKENAPKKTGNLARSIHAEVTESTRTRAEVAVGTDLEYAAQVEFGGTIKPKNAKALAIPVSATAKRYSSPRDFPGKLTLIAVSDKVYLIGPKGMIHYILVKSVNQPARPYLRPAFDDRRDEALREIGESLNVLLRQVAG